MVQIKYDFPVGGEYPDDGKLCFQNEGKQEDEQEKCDQFVRFQGSCGFCLLDAFTGGEVACAE